MFLLSSYRSKKRRREESNIDAWWQERSRIGPKCFGCRGNRDIALMGQPLFQSLLTSAWVPPIDIDFGSILMAASNFHPPPLTGSNPVLTQFLSWFLLWLQFSHFIQPNRQGWEFKDPLHSSTVAIKLGWNSPQMHPKWTKFSFSHWLHPNPIAFGMENKSYGQTNPTSPSRKLN